jgi:hypothetical protein
MGLLDGLLGRRKPTGPNLDSLFALPNAAVTLDAALGFRPTGRGAAAFRAVEGVAFADVERDVRALLDADAGPPVTVDQDSFGYTWLVVSTTPPDASAIVTDLHAVNVSLAESGFGPQLLCSHLSFSDDQGRSLALVYLYKRGTFYPFAPLDADRRDNVVELQVRDALKGELPLEADLTRWFAIWGAPGL